MTIYRVGNSSLNLRNPVTAIRHRCAQEGQWTRNTGGLGLRLSMTLADAGQVLALATK